MSRYLTARHTGLLLLVSSALAAVGCVSEPGPAQEFATEMCVKLGLGSCSTPML